MPVPPITHPSFIDRLTDPAKMGVQSQGGLNVLTPTSVLGNPDYQSPYQLRFQFGWQDLVTGFNQPPYNSIDAEAAPSFDHSWGPEQIGYPQTQVPNQFKEQATLWYAERLIAVTAAMIGYHYRHHHIPDWNPDSDWYTTWNDPSNKLSQQIQQAIKNPQAQPPLQKLLGPLVGQGLDCSNFTRFAYNYALGIQLNSATPIQGDPAEPNYPYYTPAGKEPHKPFKPTVIYDPNNDYSALCSQLRTGDLLFIAGSSSKETIQQDIKNKQVNVAGHTIINHVVMWLGDIGYSKSGVPLIIDSHGCELIDDNGKNVPGGIWVRPFNNTTFPVTQSSGESVQSWYYDHFVWALRYF
ncbi:MAG: hypothetical protein OHK0022_18210 [Roseiflexaceae bacterium]